MSRNTSELSSETFEIKNGFPLERFHGKKKARINKFIEENVIIHATNDYKPASLDSSDEIKCQTRNILKEIPNLGFVSPKYYRELMRKDKIDNMRHAAYDPLRGNILVSTPLYYDSGTLFITAIGHSTSQLLVFTSLECKHTTDDGSQVSIPMDKLEIRCQEELDFPIQQIVLSPRVTEDKVIFAVRTTVAVHLFEIDKLEEVNEIHVFDVHNRSIKDPEIDHSVPYHVELSPYNNYQYLLITGNNYLALVDGLNDKILFDGFVNIPKEVDYSSLFRSCAFGNSSLEILVATPQCVQRWTIHPDKILAETVYTPAERIFGFKRIPSTDLYCVATFDCLEIINCTSEAPIVKCAHRMINGPPTHLSVTHSENFGEEKWSFSAFSPFTQCVFYFVLRCSKTFKNPEVEDMRHFQLQKLTFEDNLRPNLHIPAYGLIIEDNGNCKTKQHFSIYRSFEDGSMRVQYIAVDCTPHPVCMETRPEYTLIRGDAIEEMYEHVKKAKAPEYTDGDRDHTKELVSVNTNRVNRYLERLNEEKMRLHDRQRVQVVERLRSLKTRVTLDELIGEDGKKYEIEEVNEFLNQSGPTENVEKSTLPESPALLDNTSHAENEKQREALVDRYEKEMNLSKSVVRPAIIPHSTHLQYLPRSTPLASTMTSRIMGSLWTVDNAPSSRLIFPLIIEGMPLPTDLTFPRAADQSSFEQMKNEPIAENAEEESTLPAVQSTAPTTRAKRTRTAGATQPTPKAIKKKKTKTAGFR